MPSTLMSPSQYFSFADHTEPLKIFPMNLSLQNDLWWGAQLRLVAWAGFQSRLGPYGAIDKPTPSDGTVRVIFAPEGRGLDPLNTEELRLISWFITHEPEVSAAVKQAIINWASGDSAARDAYASFGDVPPIANEPDLQRYFGLLGMTIHQIENTGMPYIGYEFGCDFEEEHGFGVLMHGTRVVEIGYADTALNLWRAVKDHDLK
jgi:hypothetical protein